MAVTPRHGKGGMAGELRQVRVAVASGGSCFGPCLTPRSVLEGEEGGGELRVGAIRAGAVGEVLSASGAPAVLLWAEEAAVCTRGGTASISLSYHLRGITRTRRLPIKDAKVKTDARLTLSPKHFVVATEAARGLLPLLLALLAEVERHPAVVDVRAGAGEEMLSVALEMHPMVVLPAEGGLVLVGKEGADGSLRRAMLRFDFSPSGLAMVALPTAAALSAAVAAYSASTVAAAPGRPVSSFAEAEVIFHHGAATGVNPMATVKRAFTSITPRTGMQLAEPASPGVAAMESSSLSKAVATLQGYPPFAKHKTVALLADGCKNLAGGATGGWWAAPCVGAGVVELLVNAHHGQVGGEGTEGVVKAARVVVLAIAGSAPEFHAASVAERVARACQDALSSASPPTVTALLQLLTEGVSLPVLAAAVGSCGLAEDLIALYAEYSEQMYEKASSGSKKAKRGEGTLYDASLNPFSREDDGGREGALLANWGTAMWPGDTDAHGRSAVTLGRPAPLASSASIPEHVAVAAASASNKIPFRSLSGTLEGEASHESVPEGGASHRSSKPPTAAAASPSPGSTGKPHVPRLALPSPTPGGGPLSTSANGGPSTPLTAGLTRSSRRAMSTAQSGGSRLISPVRASLNFPLPGGGKDVSGSGHLTAAQDLSALGRTLGEGLIAADLSALVVHKRMRAAVGGRASSSSSVAGDLSTATELPSPSSHTAWHWPPDLFLRAAHRPSWGATSAASTATPPLSAKGAAAGSEPRAVTLKCLILEVLLQLEGLGLSSGKVGGGPAGWTPGVRSPANLLASELCATDAPTARKDGAPAGDAQLLWPRPLLCTARLRTLVVAATHVLDAAAGRTGGRRARSAAVVMRVRGVLMQLLEQRPPAGPGADLPVLDHITVQLQILREWLSAGCAPGLAEDAVAMCGEQLLAVRALLRRWRMSSWSRAHLCLAHALIGFLSLLAERAASAPLLGRWLIATLLEAEDGLALLGSYTRGPLFGPVDRLPPGFAELNAAEVFSMRLAALRFWSVLVELVGRQPPAEPSQEDHSSVARLHLLPSASAAAGSSSMSGDDELVGHLGAAQLATQFTGRSSAPASSARTAGSEQPSPGRGFTRRQALQPMAFLVDATNGVALRVLERIHESGQLSGEQAGALHRAALTILAATFRCPGCPAVEDKRTVDFYVHYHFLAFVKLYHSPAQRGTAHLALARAHLAVLAALAVHKGSAVVRRFFQLRIADFLVRELSLEFECHMTGGQLPAATGGSQPSSSRPSSAVPSARLSAHKLSDADGAASSRLPTDRAPPAEPTASGSARVAAQERPRGVPPLRGFPDRTGGMPPPGKPMLPPLGSTRGSTPAQSRNNKGNIVRSHSISLDPTPMCSQREGEVSSRAPVPHSGSPLGGVPQETAASSSVGPLDPLPPCSPDSARGRSESPGSSSSSSSSRCSDEDGPPLPEGIQFTGDLEEDLALLEAMEDGGGSSSGDSSSGSSDGSPTPRQRVPSIAIPRLSIPTKSSQSLAATEAQQVPQLSLGKLTDSAPPALVEEGSLGALQRSVEEGGKLQVALTQTSKQRPAPASPAARSTARSSLQDSSVNYADECMLRGLYRDPELHLLVLQVVLELLISESGQLSPLYCSQTPHELHRQNIPTLLHHHLNHPDNAWLLPRLLEVTHRQGPAAVLLLRLLAAPLFSRGLYTATQRIARGAYSTVFRCSLPSLGQGTPATVALKVVDMPESIHDHCSHVDVFNEVNILRALAGVPGVCQMYDFGISRDAFCIVLRDYPCNLLEWRRRQPKDPSQQLRLYVRLFQAVCNAMQELHRRGVVHFDLKCENIMLAPLRGVGEEQFWHPPSDELPFEVALSDFGESKLWRSGGGGGGEGGGAWREEAALTVRNRGTEYIKSPEMLMVANAQKKGRDTYDRRKREGAGTASDVWSVGCLLAEICLGDWLFYDPDWIRFFIRLTRPGEELIPPERRAELAGFPIVLDLLDYILVRDPSRRPSLSDVSLRVATMFSNAESTLPPYSRPPPWVAPTREMGSIQGAPAAPGDAFFQSRAAVVGGEPAGPWMNFYNSGAATVVAPGLALATAAAALRPGCLVELGVTAVVLLRPAAGPSAAPVLGLSEAAQLVGVAQSSGIQLLQLHLPLPAARQGKSGSTVPPDLLPRALSFMAAAGALWPPRAAHPRGAVLIAAGAAEVVGEAAAVACAALLERLRPAGAGVYEAAMLLGWRRLGLGITPAHLATLAAWHDRRCGDLRPPGRTAADACVAYGCPCGAFRAVLPSPLDQTAGPNPADTEDCPADCAAIAAEQAESQPGGVAAAGVRWARVGARDVALDPLSPLSEAVDTLGARPGWSLYRCSVCGAVTHARRGGEDDGGRVAVLAYPDDPPFLTPRS